MTRTFTLFRLLAIITLLLVGLGLLRFAAPASAAEVTGVVNADGLNLRVGPGLNYQVFRVLPAGQTLSLLGRSVDSKWIEVRLHNGAGGWVFGAYVNSAVSLSSLPVTEASGGPAATAQPETFTCANTPWELCMTIVDDEATVYLQKYPKNAAVIVKLGLNGGPEVEAARAVTDANGAAKITFDMPAYWPDGRRITETNLVLSVKTADGSFSRAATIQYAP